MKHCRLCGHEWPAWAGSRCAKCDAGREAMARTMAFALNRLGGAMAELGELAERAMPAVNQVIRDEAQRIELQGGWVSDDTYRVEVREE